MRQRLVIDTNVVVNALRRGHKYFSKSARLLWHIYRGHYDIYASIGILDEYKDVLSRPAMDVPYRAMSDWVEWITRNAVFIEPRPSEQSFVEMKDEDDRIFFDVAKCARAKLVTRNIKDYPVHEIITPVEEIYP